MILNNMTVMTIQTLNSFVPKSCLEMKGKYLKRTTLTRKIETKCTKHSKQSDSAKGFEATIPSIAVFVDRLRRGEWR